MNKRGDRVVYHFDNFRDLYAQLLPELRALVTGAKTDEPALSAYCLKCWWWGHCEQAFVKAQDVTLLPDVGRSKKAPIRTPGEKPCFPLWGLGLGGFANVEGSGVLLGHARYDSGKVVYLDRDQSSAVGRIPSHRLRCLGCSFSSVKQIP